MEYIYRIFKWWLVCEVVMVSFIAWKSSFVCYGFSVAEWVELYLHSSAWLWVMYRDHPTWYIITQIYKTPIVNDDQQDAII